MVTELTRSAAIPKLAIHRSFLAVVDHKATTCEFSTTFGWCVTQASKLRWRIGASLPDQPKSHRRFTHNER